MNEAIRQFGDRGFEGASTRSITSAAGTVMSSITYHFGSKEGLYLACADHIADAVRASFAPLITGLPPAETMDKTQAARAIWLLIEELARLMISEASSTWASFVIREQQYPGPAFDRLYTGAMADMADLLARLIRRARPDLDDMEARALGLSLFAQAIALRSARATVTHVLNIPELHEAAQTLLLGRIKANVECLLRSDQPS